MTNKCGNCVFGHAAHQDFTKRICKGGPPQVVIFPHPQGAQMQFHYPIVESVADGCALHKKRIVIDSDDRVIVEQ